MINVLLYDKTPVIGKILKDWIKSVMNGTSDINFTANFNELNLNEDYRADIVVLDIDYPLESIYDLINNLTSRNSNTQFLFTTFSIASSFDFKRIETQNYRLYEKSQGYFDFCSNLRSVRKVLDTCE